MVFNIYIIYIMHIYVQVWIFISQKKLVLSWGSSQKAWARNLVQWQIACVESKRP